MNKITITIETNKGSALNDDKLSELTRILTELTEKLKEGKEPNKILDINGNAVGFVEYD